MSLGRAVRTSAVLETRLLDGILNGFGVAVWSVLLCKMFPDVADISATPRLYIVHHVLDSLLRDLWLAARRLSNALVIAESAVASTTRYLETVEDFVV